MRGKASYTGIYQYKYLPQLAKSILDRHVTEFAEEQLHLSKRYNVPLLKLLSHYSDEELIELSSKSVTEFLGYLATNDAAEQIATSLDKWVANQLEVIGKYDIVAEDITLLNHVRGKSLKNFATRLYIDSGIRHELLSEIDDFLLASTTAGANTFIAILKGRIDEEEEFRSKLSDALPGYIYVYDLNQKKEVYSNDKLRTILGYSTQQAKEISEEYYKSITHPEDWKTIIDLRKNSAANSGAVNSFEVRLKDSGGNYKWMRNYETILRATTNKKIKEIIGVAFDVTAEKEITEALAKSEAQLLEAQSIAHIGSFEWDITGQVSTTNTPEIYRIFELEEMEKFEEFMQHVHCDDVEKVRDAVKQSFKTGEYECVYRYLRNNKEKIIWSRGVVTINNGVPLKMVGTVQDVTDIKRIEAELKKKTTELEKSNESLQQFASIASHDLKEPLRKISIYGSVVLNGEKGKHSTKSEVALRKIIESAARMQQMINDILQFSFIENEQQKTETDLEQTLQEVKELLSETITEKKATIISDGLPTATVIGPEFRQLFQNLISNALKFSKENEPPVIRITHSYHLEKPAAAAEKKHLIICVADNGIGFDERDREKIFGLFYRLHSKSQFEGSGLGLSICNKIVEKHNGKITAESKPGKGSTFKILLPV